MATIPPSPHRVALLAFPGIRPFDVSVITEVWGAEGADPAGRVARGVPDFDLRRVAATIARSMVTAPFRTGTQAQFIEQPTPRTDQSADALAAVRAYALQHLDEPLTVGRLAARAGMSVRTFARRFGAATGATPLHWLLDQRVAAAQKLLEHTDLPMPEVARRTGFGSEITMRQHFGNRISTSPRAYRASFAAARGPGPRNRPAEIYYG